MPIKACQGCLKDQFFTTTEAIDCFTGTQLWMWGINANGRLGDSSLINRSSPVQTASSTTNWKCAAVSAHNWGGSAGIKSDNTLWLWGSSFGGTLGNNLNFLRSSPIQTISGGTNWGQISLGYRHHGAIKTDGTLWLWGQNNSGQLGENTIIDRSSPVQTVSLGTDWKCISVGYRHSASIKTDGSLFAWGCNLYGQVGNGNTINQLVPVENISGGTNWKSISLGSGHSAAIKTDGSLWMWGRNVHGILGDNTLTNRSSPVQTVLGGTNWKQISAGSIHTTAIKLDGSLWVWGSNDSGRLGDNTLINRSTPIQTISGGTNWKQISAGNTHTAAIKTDGTLWSWGVAFYGQLGNDSILNTSSPVQTVTGGVEWRQVSAGFGHTAAIKSI